MSRVAVVVVVATIVVVVVRTSTGMTSPPRRGTAVRLEAKAAHVDRRGQLVPTVREQYSIISSIIA